jgi:Tfp pilus assembly PilM family ATPase
VDIGHDGVKMIQLERRGSDGTLSVVAAARVPLPEKSGAARQARRRRSHIAAQLIADGLRDHPFRGRRIVVALPRELLSVRNLRVSVRPGQSLAEAVRLHDGSIAHFICAGEVAGAQQQQQQQQPQQEVIALMAREGETAQFVEALDAAGLELAALDAEPCALYRTIGRFVRRREDEQDVHALVDVGYQGSRVIIGRGRDIRFVRLIPMGGVQFHEAVGRALGISVVEARALRRQQSGEAAAAGRGVAVRQAARDASRAPMEELSRQIDLCLRYDCVTFRGQRPTKLRLVGGEAADPQLLSILSRLLPIPVVPMPPPFSMDTTDKALGEWGLALGLALRWVPETTFGPRDGKPRLASMAAEVALA